MHFKILAKESIAEQLLPLDELQGHLRVFDPHEDELIETYRAAAINFAENYMNRALGIHTVKATFEKYRSRTYLPFGDVQEIVSISAIDQDKLIDLDQSEYRFNDVSGELIINSRNSRLTDFVVLYKVGKPVEQIDAAIKIGIMRLTAHFYESREDVSFGVSVAQVPFNHQYCFDLFRLPATA